MCRLTDDYFRYVPAACKIQNFIACLVSGEIDGFRAKALGDLHMLSQPLDVLRARLYLAGGFHRHSNPLAWSPAAIRFAARMSRSANGLGPTQTRIRSEAGHTSVTPLVRR